MAEPVGIGLVGYGYWGPNYARVFSDLPGARLAAICDRDASRLDQARARYRQVPMYRDVDDLVRRTDVDAVVISTQASTHAPLVAQVLQAGRHVLVEKPMALDVATCEALCEQSARADRLVMVGYTFLYNAGIRKMKECMAIEEFGRVYYLHATRTNLGPIRHDVSALWDLAPHDVAIFNYLLGEVPEWASAVGARVLRNDRDDVGFATLGYSDNVMGNIHVSWADPNKVREVVAVGSRRRVVFNDLNDSERVRLFERGVSVSDAVADSFGEFRLLVRDGDIVSPKVEPSEPLKNQCLDFIDAITTKRKPLADIRFACDVVRALVAIEASMRCRGAAKEV